MPRIVKLADDRCDRIPQGFFQVLAPWDRQRQPLAYPGAPTGPQRQPTESGETLRAPPVEELPCCVHRDGQRRKINSALVNGVYDA